MSKFEELEKLAKLKESGILSEEEFLKEKEAILKKEDIAKPKNTKKIIIIIISVVVITFLSGFTINYFVEKENAKREENERIKKENELELKLTNYKLNIQSLETSILNEATELETMVIAYIKVWGEAIKSSYKDFNDELIKQFKQFSTENEKRKEGKIKIDELMKNLQNPPENYLELYKLILEFYSTYTELYEMALNPSGSFSSYTSKKRDTTDKLINIFNKIKIITPQK